MRHFCHLLVPVLLLSCGGRSCCSSGSVSPSTPPPAKKAASPAPPATVIARLTATYGEVKHRRPPGTSWSLVRAGLELAAGDVIKTGHGAAARVTFSQGGYLEIEDLSLVMIQAQAPVPGQKGPGPHLARVEAGAIRGVSLPGVPGLQVVTADGQKANIRSDGDAPVPFRVRLRSEGQLEVAVLKGAARVESGTQSVKLASNQAVDLSRRALSAPVQLPAFPELEDPGVDARFRVGTAIELKWLPVPGAVRYRVQISNSAGFEGPALERQVRGTAFTFSPAEPAPAYFWRVASVDGGGREGEFGFARRFYVSPGDPASQKPAAGKGRQLTVPKSIEWK